MLSVVIGESTSRIKFSMMDPDQKQYSELLRKLPPLLGGSHLEIKGVFNLPLVCKTVFLTSNKKSCIITLCVVKKAWVLKVTHFPIKKRLGPDHPGSKPEPVNREHKPQ